MNTAQRDFYESNVKTASNLRREGRIGLAGQIESINQFLKANKISQALQWAEAYNFPLDFILDMKDLFSGFQE